MRILVVHNYYRGFCGEDAVFDTETTALKAYGHKVVTYTRHNDELTNKSTIGMVIDTIWNHSIIKPLRSLIRMHGIEVVHYHNTFPIISPAAYYAAHMEGIPVVQTLHDFRFICMNSWLFRDGKICEDCISPSSFLPGIRHNCYRNCKTASAVKAIMLMAHRKLRTWNNVVDAYIALTDFVKQKFVTSGFLPSDKIFVKSNFVYPDPGIGTGNGGYALFAGRLSSEKGIATLIEAWRKITNQLPLKILGNGPLASLAEEATRTIDGVQWLGHLDRTEVYKLMGKAKVIIVPSICYEGMPLTIPEAFATGTPVISSNIGSMASINIHMQTGLHVNAGKPESLVNAVDWTLANPDKLHQMRLNARAEFEAKYSVTRNIEMLINIYESTIQRYNLPKGT